MSPLRQFLISIGLCLTAVAVEIPTSLMVPVTGGTYERPLEKDGKTRTVEDFLIDVRQTTNAEFLAFVTQHPEWQRSRVKRLFADQGYLSKWAGDTELGPNAPPDAPVVCISWFAARAFLKSVDKRLPSVDEWEFVARANLHSIDANDDPTFKTKILDWYSRPTPDVLPDVTKGESNIYGATGMHGIVWEWTANFVSAMTSGEARSDGTLNAQQFCGGGGADPNQATEYANFMRMAFRSSLKGDFCLPGLGFRGARDAEPSPDPNP
ncbi:MAG: formylglycine-generating enzyme family protein [Luteolibacter sp.]